MPLDDLLIKLIGYKKAYYSGTPLVSDAEFDRLEDELRKINPSHAYFKMVGAKGNIKEKVTHKVPMLSCQKGKVFSDIQKWASKHNVEKEMFLAMAKIDGMSGNCVYENGKLVQIVTRGDGSIGQDVSHLINYINVPKTIDIKSVRIEVRGEIYIAKNTKLDTKGSPLRNLCVGLVGRKGHGLDDLKHIHFVAYQVLYDNFKSESYKMSWLLNNHFEVVEHKLLGLDDLEAYREEYITSLRDKWNYESDGLVICVNDNTKWDRINSAYEVHHHNHYNIAWKPESETAETVLEGIDWQVSRSGKLIPVGVVKPVSISGRTVSRASLTCYENVIRMKFEKGDKVEIMVANDVIPYLSGNITKGTRQR